MVEKFTKATVEFENKLSTEDQMKKNAAGHVATLIRLREVETLKVDHVIQGFLDVIGSDRDNLDSKINTVCKDLYDMINATKE